MGKLIDLTDKTFGSWKVMRKATKEERESAKMSGTDACWWCECSCGKVKMQHGYMLLRGDSSSCGHDTNSLKELSGKFIGDWYVIRRATEQDIKEYRPLMIRKTVYWLCRCTCCGNRRIVASNSLNSGKSNSCGCRRGKHRERDKLRTKEQIKLMENSNELEEKLIDFEYVHKRKPNTNDIKEMLGMGDITSALNYIKRKGFVKYIDTCNKGTSNLELEIKESLYLDNRLYINKDRKALNGLEIDILINKKMLAIEINGSYWHNELEKNKYYHQSKTEIARSKGIELIHVFEYEWKDKRKHDIIINILRDKIHGTKVISSSECQIKTVSLDEQISFNNKYHLDGNTGCLVCYGMYYNEELVSLMSFGKPRKRDEKASWELLRYTKKFGISVTEDTALMLNEFRREHKGDIIVYTNACKDNGSWVKELGFEYTTLTEPDCVWYDLISGELLGSNYYNKNKLLEMKWGSQDQSIEDILKNTGHARIFDSGKYKFYLKEKST